MNSSYIVNSFKKMEEVKNINLSDKLPIKYEVNIEKNEEIFIMKDFEGMKLYNRYKPDGNYDIMINLMNKKTNYYMEKKKKIQKKANKIQRFLRKKTRKTFVYKAKQSISTSLKKMLG